MISFAEKLLMPMLFFTLMLLLPMYFVDKKGFTKFAAGIGPFMLFRRKAYETIGTHSSVKAALVEDVWLARKIKQSGLKLVIADGSNILSVRMYRSLREIWEGFSKNIFAGFEFSTFTLSIVNTVYILLFFLPFILFARELYLQFFAENLLQGMNQVFFLTGIQVFILYLTRFLLAVRFKLGFLSSLLHPLGAIMVPVIAVNSWRWIKLTRGARWKGRVYSIK
jgi:chlorobactene glucosyltransferase